MKEDSNEDLLEIDELHEKEEAIKMKSPKFSQWKSQLMH
jgi:hypothetical protein